MFLFQCFENVAYVIYIYTKSEKQIVFYLFVLMVWEIFAYIITIAINQLNNRCEYLIKKLLQIIINEKLFASLCEQIFFGMRLKNIRKDKSEMFWNDRTKRVDLFVTNNRTKNIYTIYIILNITIADILPRKKNKNANELITQFDITKLIITSLIYALHLNFPQYTSARKFMDGNYICVVNIFKFQTYLNPS